MNSAVELGIEAARARAVPWNAERAARVLGRANGRRRSLVVATLGRLTFAGLASAVLFVSLLRFSQAIRYDAPRAHEAPSPTRGIAVPRPTPSHDDAAPEPRPMTDGGYEASVE
jgi:hypothetical protein